MNVRSLVTAVVSLLFVSTVVAQEVHRATPVEELIQRYHAIHGQAHHEMAQPEIASIDVTATKAFTVTARRFHFDISPADFVVNQGDTVTLEITASDVSHGFFLEHYDEDASELRPGRKRTVTFVANMAGTFTYLCTFFCGEGHTTMSGTFTVLAGAAAPSITSITPSTGSTAGGTPITITGANFTDDVTVTIGGGPAEISATSSATTIFATTPPGPVDIASSRAVDVVVTNSDGQRATLAGGFTYTVPSLSITAIVPNGGTTSGGTTVTILGQGFTTALPVTVTFGGVAATDVRVTSARSLTVVTPPHGAGVFDVVVTVGASHSTVSAGFAYQVPAKKRRAVRR